MSTHKSNTPSRATGRQFFFNPGPTHIPDSVLRAMHRPTIDFMAPEFKEVLTRVHERTKRVLKTEQHLLYYGTNGHGAWEGSLANVFSPGDKMLMIESGHFSINWAQMARELGLEIEVLPGDWRLGVPSGALEERLRQDTGHDIKGVMVVHNETATGLAHPIGDIRAEMNAAGHPAMLLVDTISSLASFDFRFDEWGVDLAVGSSQKGMMMITGLSFVGISERALAASKDAKITRSFVDWRQMTTVEPQRFPGTTPVHLFYGLEEALGILEAEGLDNVFARHGRLADAVRAAVKHWGGGARSGIQINNGEFSGTVEAIELLCADSTRTSDTVTAVMTPTGFDANEFRRIALDRYNLSLGQGLGPLAGKAFRIGHLGDLNEPMVLGAIATIELAMRESGLAHKSGGTEAALASLSA
ncbi:MAG: alanine-glyoxylate transaminase/serine-glyoxylate transaminase/serine-pyruvate transaminase [Alphaproteobacteria bacterium]|jgi:alanine-glyoxylate transaminase/serine-glyoxylate transaminase/serine-pyruvate transaminase